MAQTDNDTISPQVYITNPSTAGAAVNGKVVITANASDNVGVYQVKFYVDDVHKGSDTSSPYTYDWYTNTFANGEHMLKAEAHDAAGNYTQNSTMVSVQNNLLTCTSYCSTAGLTQCHDATGYKICGNYNNDTCLEWSAITACPSGTTCSGGQCLAVSCGNDCATSGATQCDGTTGYKTCGNYDDDSCYEWSPLYVCPSGKICSAGTADNEVCVYPTDTICASYTYGDWSACDASGTQKKTIVSKYPAGCVLPATVLETVTQNCTYIATTNTANIIYCASYKYGEWSVCDASGQQKRTIIYKLPENCVLPSSAPPTLIQSCVYFPPCVEHHYDGWSVCDSLGKQIRKLIYSLPDGCRGGVLPVTDQDCNYQTAANNDEITNAKTKTSDIAMARATETIDQNIIAQNESSLSKPSCDFIYSAWSACVDGRQTRMVIAKLPSDCDNLGAQLSQTCDARKEVLSLRPQDAPVPAPQSMLAVAPAAAKPAISENYNGRTSEEWQEYYFGARICRFEEICGGDADSDKDNLSNNEEYRFGTDPKNADTDGDGWVDGDEIAKGRDPLIADSSGVDDVVSYQSPKEAGQEAGEIYKVEKIEYDSDAQKLIISGKALPNSHVMLYIYSNPIVFTIKADDNGSWSYVLDKLDDGEHEVYVSVNDNQGRVIAKSAALPFVQTAEAAIVNYPAPIATQERAPAPTKSRLWEGYLIFFGTGLGGLLLAVAAIGLGRKITKNQ